GEPVAREGQDFGWTRPDAIDREPLLPATVPILAMLALPRRVIGLAVDRLWYRPRAGLSDAEGAADAGRHVRARAVFVLDVAGRSARARRRHRRGAGRSAFDRSDVRPARIAHRPGRTARASR